MSGLDGSLAGIRDDILLVVSELVSNSVRHAGADGQALIELDVEATPHWVRLEVDDHGPGFVPEPSDRPGPEGGFGLMLVDRLADRWGVYQDRPSRVWVEFNRN